MADNYSLSCHRIRVWTCNGTCLSRVTCNCKVSCATAHHIMYLYTHCTNSVWLASFPGLPALECEHWSCAGGRASYFFVTWAASKVERRLIVHGCTRSLRTGKRTKVAGNLLAIRDWILYTPRVEHIVEQCAKCYLSVLKTLYHAHVRKYTRLSPRIHIRIPEWGSLGTRLLYGSVTFTLSRVCCTQGLKLIPPDHSLLEGCLIGFGSWPVLVCLLRT